MSNEKKILSMVFVSILLIASYSYVTGEAQDAADADPTHSGKAFVAQIMSILWIVIIIMALGITLYVIAETF